MSALETLLLLQMLYSVFFFFLAAYSTFSL